MNEPSLGGVVTRSVVESTGDEGDMNVDTARKRTIFLASNAGN